MFVRAGSREGGGGREHEQHVLDVGGRGGDAHLRAHAREVVARQVALPIGVEEPPAVGDHVDVRAVVLLARAHEAGEEHRAVEGVARAQVRRETLVGLRQRPRRDVASLDPRMGHELGGGAPLGRVALQQRADELARLRRHRRPRLSLEVDVGGAHRRVELRLRAFGVGVERVGAGEQDRHDEAERPQVDLRAVGPAVDLLGRPVRRRAEAAALQLRRRAAAALGAHQRRRRAKVDHLHRRRRLVAREANILRLEVAVDDPARVRVVHGERELPHDLRGAPLGVRPVGDEALEEAAAVGALHHQRHVGRRPVAAVAVDAVAVALEPVDAEELGDVRVASDGAQRVDLLLRQLQRRRLRRLRQREQLDRHALAARRVDRQPHLAERADAELLLEAVPPAQLRPRRRLVHDQRRLLREHRVVVEN